MKKYLILLLILISVGSLYFIFSDNLPPRNPHKIARIISGLRLSGNSKTLLFKDEWLDNGDGEVYIQLQLSKDELKDLVKECGSEEYKSLPISESTNEMIEGLTKNVDGFYKIKKQQNDITSFELSVLDVSHERMIIYIIKT